MKRFLCGLIALCLIVSSADAQFVGRQQGVLASLRGANFNSTADQAIPIPAQVTKYYVTSIIVTNCAGSLTLAVGGFYPTTSKGGVALVANTQAYSTLSSATVALGAALVGAVATTAYSAPNIYFALTTAAGGAATCDIYLVGVDLS